ncbi:MAG: hypothetical protein AAGA96_12620 [Verrucomicrobiota bacterium]
MKIPPKSTWFVGVFACCYVLIVLSWQIPKHRLFSPTVEVGEEDEWNQVFSPKPFQPPGRHQHPRFSSLSANVFQRDEWSWKAGVEIPGYQIIEAGEDGVAILPWGSTVRIEAIALAGRGEGEDVPWFDLSGEKLDQPGTTLEPIWEDSSEFWPCVRLRVEQEGEAICLSKLRLFDARTQRRIDHSRTFVSETPFGQTYTDRVALWHRGPIVIVLDYAAGPVLRETIPLDEGSVADFGEVQVEIQKLLPGQWARVRIQNQPHWREELKTAGKEGLRVFGHVSPESRNRLISLQLTLTEPENVFYRNTYANFETTKGKETMEVLYRPHPCHVVFRLNSMPGLGDSIVEVEDNLFDCVIPEMTDTRIADACFLVASAVQADLEFKSEMDPNLRISGSGLSVGELMEKIRKAGARIDYDSTRRKLTVGQADSWDRMRKSIASPW